MSSKILNTSSGDSGLFPLVSYMSYKNKSVAKKEFDGHYHHKINVKKHLLIARDLPRLNRVNVQKFQQLNTNVRKSISLEVPLLKIENIL